MFEVTPKAIALVESYFSKKEKQPIRIFVKIGGCGMRTLGISLEPATAADKLFEIEGVQYIVNKRLLQRIKPIIVDSDGATFLLSGTGVYSSSGCGSCGFMCGFRGGNRCTGDCESCKHRCPDGGLKLKKALKN